MEEHFGAAIENLYPALLQCFVVILCGYLAGRMNLISETEAKGMNTFVGTFSLPALIFMSLAELDLRSVNWIFLLSILISKSVVFFSVIVITVLVGRPVNLGRAGIFAIFCTQSNDFAIGYPIVAALYRNTHPEYASYLYLMAPISLAILNPISFVLMEINKKNNLTRDEEATLTEISHINSNVSRHKQRWILGNFIFQHNVPLYLAEILNVLGSAFSASALFLLGLRMVGKIHKLTGATLVVPGILIMIKLIALPLVIREVVNVLNAGSNTSETLDLSTYGFFYGTFPSAPGVFVFATQYMMDVDLIASAMVACTFLSAPLMFVSAKMITITNCNPSEYIKQLDQFTFDVSIIGIMACIWVIIVFTLTKKISKIPHKITSCLIVSHFISCLGAILWNVTHQDDKSRNYIQFSLFTIGVYSSRLWTAILSITLLFLQCRSLCFVLKLQPYFFSVGWGVPVLLSASLLFLDTSTKMSFEKRNPNFAYGAPQAIIAVSLLVLCFIVTAGCLVLHQRYRRRFNYGDLPSESTDQLVETNVEETGHASNQDSIREENVEIAPKLTKCCGLPTIKEGCCEEKDLISPVVDIEDLISDKTSLISRKPIVTDDSGVVDDGTSEQCSTKFGCNGPQRQSCRAVVGQYQEPIDEDLEPIEEEPESHDPQILRHTVLLILLLCSMFVGLALSVWTLVMEQISGIYIELSFLDAILNFGQSIIVFVIFGLDVKEVVLPIIKFWRKLWYGANTLTLPVWDELGPDTKHICDQFVSHHLNSCKNAIASDRRWRLTIYKDVFTGNQFIDWLIDLGLARDRVEAVNYGRHLLEGKVIKHINGVYHFYDRNLLYTFV
ncbi:hypothetical protein GWI33_004610 [Rhynchophorus ferrugineus]|uniref:DEP domain-containing protein n=1 Tax=Rhynchophorus ferrugineus TaxID=354439 RepID=A0A834IYN2_RHYFE|nr:hypothetical protein GWI33_004610 [Rhynchophorus ferrugineus]